MNRIAPIGLVIPLIWWPSLPAGEHSAVYDAILNDKPALAVQLMASARDFDPNESHRHGTPLIDASRLGYRDVVKELIRRGADLNRKHASRRLPLYQAASQGHHDIAKDLLAAGADPNLSLDRKMANGYVVYGATPLHGAALAHDVEMIRLLHKAGARIDVHANKRGGPLTSAACESRDDPAAIQATFRLLRELGCDPNEFTTASHSPLLTAIRYRNVTAVKELLSYDELEVDRIAPSAGTPLLVAVTSRLDKGPEKDPDRQLAELAQIVRMLLKAGADPTKESAPGHTPLSDCCHPKLSDIMVRHMRGF